MNEKLKRANLIKKDKWSTSEFKEFTGKEADLQSQAEALLAFYPNFSVIRIPDAAYRAIFANEHVSQRVKGLISSFLRGIPDITIIKKGETGLNLCLCIEFKVGKNKMTQGQKKFANRANVIECRSFEKFTHLIEEFSK